MADRKKPAKTLEVPKAPKILEVPKTLEGPTATCPECGDVREVSAYFDPAVHEARCPTCHCARLRALPDLPDLPDR